MRRLLRAAACAVAFVAVPAGPAAAAPGPSVAPQYWFDDWHVFDLWDAGARGQGITIAEIDTGVNASLPDLTGRVLSGTDLGVGGDGRTDRDRDKFGHGTAMASLMVARPGKYDITGMAPDARVIPIAVPLNGTTDSGMSDRLADAIRYGADHGANIISMSLGGKRFPRTDDASCPADEQAAVFHALSKGVVVVASVGNTGPTKNTVEEPGVCLGVVSVGAVDAHGTVASFSARQPYLTLVAPGVNIPTIGRIDGQAFFGDGTSQAAAITSATLAIVWSKYRSSTGRQVVTRVLDTLDRRGGATHTSAYGYGEINAQKAVTRTVDVNGPNPVYDTAAPFLARAAALAKPAAVRAPAPVATSGGHLGHYSVGSLPRVTPRVRAGLAVAAAGLLALLVLLVFGVRGWRRRRALAATAGPRVEPYRPDPPPTRHPDGPYAAPQTTWHAEPPEAGPPAHRPRPTPRPSRPADPPGPLSWRDVPVEDD